VSLVTYGLGAAGAPLRFLMRAYHTIGPIGYVYWEVTGSPDPIGTFAPYPAVNLLDIVTAYAYPQAP